MHWIKLSLFRSFIFTSFFIAFSLDSAAYGRIQRNVRDGIQSASSFCHSVVGLSWSHSQGKKPTATHFSKAANEVGSQLVGTYGKDAPKKYSLLFVDGWNKGMKNCYRQL